MEKRNTYDTYFRIVGNFDPDAVSAKLGLVPEKIVKMEDLRRDGSRYDFASWEIGHSTGDDPNVAAQMEKTIAPLLDKLALLCQIREENAVSFYLEVVPHVWAGEIAPILAPPLSVIDFCHATRCEIDIDLYVYGEE